MSDKLKFSAQRQFSCGVLFLKSSINTHVELLFRTDIDNKSAKLIPQKSSKRLPSSYF